MHQEHPQRLLLSRKQVESEFGIPAATLSKWSWEGAGPPFLKLGRRVFYRRAELEIWLDQHKVNSTSTPSCWTKTAGAQQ